MDSTDEIRRLLRRLDTFLGELREFDATTEAEYLGSGILQDALERRLQLATEVCIDLADGIVRLLGLRAPADYADLFRILAEEGLIDPDLMQRMQRLARYRNRLVHDYEGLEPARVLTFRRSRLGDFAEFALFVDAFIANAEDGATTAPHQP